MVRSPLTTDRVAAAALAAAALTTGPVRIAPAQDVVADPSPHSEAALIAETRSVRPGEPFTAGLRLTLEPEWHTYWKNPGDSGEPVSIEWELLPGFTAGPIQWPAPERISFPPLVSYGYFDEVVLPIEITVPAHAVPGDTVRISARAYWLVCIEDCFPAEAELSLALEVTDAPLELEPAAARAIAEARARLPVRDPTWEAAATASDSALLLRIERTRGGVGADLAEAHFFAADGAVIDHAAEQVIWRDGDALMIRLARSPFSTSLPDTLRGVLVADRAVEIAAPFGRQLVTGPAGSASEDPDAAIGLAVALLFAVLGGLLLNLMPCVFPVLSLKVLGFVEHADAAGGSPARQGAAFATGVLVSFWVLGGLLLAVRGADASVGWGFQLQSPLFVGAMALLFFVLALALLGVFEIGLGLTRLGGISSGKISSRDHPPAAGGAIVGTQRTRHRTARSFGAGVLATVVATPCTAPFMGVALGWALLRPPAETMLVFTALGAGMAGPYVGLSLSPGLIDRLPAPGPWMGTLKQLLAFPLFATVVWLAWVFGLQTGVAGLTGLLAALLVAGFAAWLGGRSGAPESGVRRRFATRVAVFALGLGALVVLVRAAASPVPGAGERASVNGGSGVGMASASAAAWQRWTPEAAAQARAAAKPLFIDFTAAWCLSCQVNERLVLGTDEVRKAFRTHRVTLLKADWTRRDPEITAALAALGRSSVPVYALYPLGGGDPMLLPSVLTNDIVIEALKRYAPVPGSRSEQIETRDSGGTDAPQS